ncbi:MAG TPA: efflux RND transporter periplasmic adaptor subunit [Thermoanaerobaculia bacterium]|nr:efflux RND transporter periplasmic adaptor subunit [Thermoanaerobaculia bacterium]
MRVLIVGLVLLVAGCKGAPSSAEAQEKEPAKPVRTDRVAERMLSTTVVVSGTLAAFDRATVGVKVPGRLQTIAVDLGSAVTRGQLIARVDPTDYRIRLDTAEAALAQARARLGLPPEGASDAVDPDDTPSVRAARALLDEARATSQRFASLHAGGLVSKADLDQAVSAARVAESRYQDAFEEIRNRQAVMSQRRAEVALARQQLADTGVYASFHGVVERRHASPGEFLAAGAPVADVVRVNPLRFRAEVPERDAANIRVGQNVQLSVDGSTRAYTGLVTRLSPTITERSRVLIMEADIPNDGVLRAGSFARASIVTNASEPALTVPADAVITFAGIQKVVVLENGQRKEKPVTLGRRMGQWTEVLSGVKAGEVVVLNAETR